MNDLELEKIEEEVDRLIREGQESEDENIRKKVADLKVEIADYKVQETREKVLKILKDGYEAGEYTEEEYKQMISEPDKE